MREILLDKKKSFKSINKDNRINVKLNSEQSILPYDNYTVKMDSYQKYFAEKDSSDKYRLIFTINPVCSNILFNPNTEIVYKEGSDECIKVSESGSDFSKDSDIKGYCEYKGIKSPNLSSTDMIRDTAFSHKDIGGLVYHCGVDIFNNHFLRKRNFSVINKLGSDDEITKKYFNTIEDYARDKDGKEIEETLFKASNDGVNTGKTKVHLYQYDDIMQFRTAINNGLVESDGWVGFINPVSMNIDNYVTGKTSISINKCMNNNKGGEMIDMYPDRSLYSFLPKYNKYRNRQELNWDYCITYPAKSIYDNILVTEKNINGLECECINFNKSDVNSGNTYYNVTFRTTLRNTFQKGEFVNFSFINGTDISETNTPVKIESIGYNGADSEHYFSVNLSDISSAILQLTIAGSELKGRVRKNEKGIDCKYYIRKFRRMPNFNNTDVYADGVISDDDIEKYSKINFNSSLNKLAFSENIFSDKIAQIIYNDDIITTGLRDNLGRPLTELYLTIVKSNRGNDKWENGNCGDPEVEFSHCFGKISSGLDISPDYGDYNVHKINAKDGYQKLEDNISIEGDDGYFLGDIVEFSPYDVMETVIEKIYHRFNTVQREKNETKINYDSFSTDDYDLNSGFTIDKNVLKIGPSKEGYFYCPHYPIKIREFAELVQQGEDIKLNFIEDKEPVKIAENTYECTTSIPYYLKEGDMIYLYNKDDGKIVNAIIESVSGRLFTEVKFKTDSTVDIDKNIIFKPNPLKPDYAFELNDGTGRYLWRGLRPSVEMMYGDDLYDSMFTNGAHYFHNNINFYLRRQDPLNIYGINGRSGENETLDVITNAAYGEIKDVSIAEYVDVDTDDGDCE